MKRVISIALTMAICLTLFTGLSVNVSAATNDWLVHSQSGYYDASNKIDYQVIIFYKEDYKTRLFFIKDHYVKQVKVVTYVITRDGNWAKVNQVTSVLRTQNETHINSVLDYLHAYYPKLDETYRKMLHEQDNYRMLYLFKRDNPNGNFMKHYSNYTIKRYIKEYKKHVLGEFDDVNDFIAEASGFVLPPALKFLGSASDINNDIQELQAICEDAIVTLFNCFDLFLLCNFTKPSMEQLANGVPTVKSLLEEANGYCTSSKKSTRYLNSDKCVWLESGIYSDPLK